MSYIKLDRRIVDWEWFDDPLTLKLFIYLLVKANHADGRWHGIDIKRGQHLTSLQTLAGKNCMTVQQVRTRINRLKSTHEITCKSTNKYMLITIEKYDVYQGAPAETNTQINTQTNNQVTCNQHATNMQLTTNKKDKEGKEEIRIIKKELESAPDDLRRSHEIWQSLVGR